MQCWFKNYGAEKYRAGRMNTKHDGRLVFMIQQNWGSLNWVKDRTIEPRYNSEFRDRTLRVTGYQKTGDDVFLSADICVSFVKPHQDEIDDQ